MTEGTNRLPMGPRYVDACAKAIKSQYISGEVTAEQIIGFAWYWARERGVSGWSKARLSHDEGTLLNDPEEIATAMEEGNRDG